MIARALPIAAAAGALVLAACGGTSADDAVPAGTAAVAAAPTAPAANAPAGTSAPGDDAPAVPAALQFSAPLLGGGEIEMGRFAGRPVLLWFWAPW